MSLPAVDRNAEVGHTLRAAQTVDEMVDAELEAMPASKAGEVVWRQTTSPAFELVPEPGKIGIALCCARRLTVAESQRFQHC